MATSSLRMYAYSCGSDEYCWNLIVNLTSTESMTGDASAPYDLAKCYPDLGYICDCSQVWAWTGKLCNKASSSSSTSALVFILPLLLSMLTFIFRVRIVVSLFKMKLLHINATNISIGLSLLSLIAILLLSVVYLVIYLSPAASSIDFVRIGDVFIQSTVILSLVSLIFAYIDIAKHTTSDNQGRRLGFISLFAIFIFMALATLSFTGEKKLINYLSMGITSLIVLGVFVSADALFVIFADSFRMGVTRRNRWKKYYGGSLLICFDIQGQVIKHLLCKIDVAAGRRHSDIIRQADEASIKKSSRNIISDLSLTRSVSMDSQTSTGMKWPMPKGMRKLTRDDSFNSQLGFGRDTSPSEAMDRTRTQSALDMNINSINSNNNNNNESNIHRKDLSFANKRYSEKIVRFLSRVFAASSFVAIAHALALCALYNGSITETKHNSSIPSLSEAALWKALLLVGFALIENAVLWFVEDAARSRIKHELESKQKVISIQLGSTRGKSFTKKPTPVLMIDTYVKAETLSPLSSHITTSLPSFESRGLLPSA